MIQTNSTKTFQDWGYLGIDTICSDSALFEGNTISFYMSFYDRTLRHGDIQSVFPLVTFATWQQKQVKL